jgi:uncharacterized membrane protein
MAVPAASPYHRWMGWHASAGRRLLSTAAVGVLVALVLTPFVPWGLAVLGGWDGAALAFLGTVWRTIARADAGSTRALATREDLTRDVARLLVLAASAASTVAVVLALTLARRESGFEQILLVAIASVTVVLSWTMVNTVFTLRYADLHYNAPEPSVDFLRGPGEGEADYRDFAYLAFTIGMTYQVSDTNLRNRTIRRTVLAHAFLSYVFGVVIVSVGVNVIAGLAD